MEADDSRHDHDLVDVGEMIEVRPGKDAGERQPADREDREPGCVDGSLAKEGEREGCRARQEDDPRGDTRERGELSS